MALLGRGKPEEAVTIFEKNAFPVYRLDGLAISYHRMGQSRESRAALDELVMRYPLSAAYQIAEVHAFRGETDAAFDWLERARLQHDGGLKYVRFDPQFQAIHPDARWKLFLKKLNLPVD
jgi:predicted Zn-dependent protease